MARKTLHPIPARAGHYADFPACLPTYKWLVEEALRAPDKMFNTSSIPGASAHYCKVCGAAYLRKDWKAHVNEHAAALKLAVKTTVANGVKVVRVETVKEEINEELKLTIIDSLSERLGDLGLQFTINYGLLGDKVARTINDVSKDGGASVPSLCRECQ